MPLFYLRIDSWQLALTVSIANLNRAADPASAKCFGEPGSARTPSLQSAARQLFATPQESPKPALNERDILESPASKLDLSPQCLGIPQQGGCLYKAAEIVLKTTERGFHSAHFYSLHLV